MLDDTIPDNVSFDFTNPGGESGEPAKPFRVKKLGGHKKKPSISISVHEINDPEELSKSVNEKTFEEMG